MQRLTRIWFSAYGAFENSGLPDTFGYIFRQPLIWIEVSHQRVGPLAIGSLQYIDLSILNGPGNYKKVVFKYYVSKKTYYVVCLFHDSASEYELSQNIQKLVAN